MEEFHRKILRENRSYLVHEIDDVEGINDILLEKGILTIGMNQDILAEKTEIARARKLLDTLPRRGQHAFDIFCNVLIKTNQRHIAERLNPELRNARVTAVPAEPVTSTNKTGVNNQPASSQRAGNKEKQNNAKYPQPVQLPFRNNNSKGSNISGSNLPNPVYPTGAFGTKAGSQPSTPNDEEIRITTSRQESWEATRNVFLDKEVLENFPKPVADWPYKLDMTLNSKVFELKYCTPLEVKQQLSDPNTYEMPGDKVRRALIISNRNFEDEKYEDRKLADMDSFRVQQVLKKMDFKIETVTNVGKQELMQCLTKEREDEGSELCVFVLVILSYGGLGTILCTDGEFVPIQDILEVFSAKNCPQMVGIPKLVLLQACGTILKNFHEEFQSKEGDENVTTGMEGLNLGATGGGKTVTDTKGRLHSSASESSLSDLPAIVPEEDMLVAMAKTADVNHAQYSSLFLLGLSYVISNYAKTDHFITLLNAVNRLKKSEDSDDTVTLCDYKASLTKKLYLLPGYPHNVPYGAEGPLPAPPLFGSTKPT